MTKWNKLLQALNQAFKTPNGAASTVKPLHQAFDAEAKEQVGIFQYRFKSDIDSSPGLQKLLNDRRTSTSQPKRLLNAIKDALFAGGKWPR